MGAVVTASMFILRLIGEVTDHRPNSLAFLVLGLWVVGQSIAHTKFIRNHLDLSEVDP